MPFQLFVRLYGMSKNDFDTCCYNLLRKWTIFYTKCSLHFIFITQHNGKQTKEHVLFIGFYSPFLFIKARPQINLETTPEVAKHSLDIFQCYFYK